MGRQLWGIFFGSLLLFTIGLPSQEIIGFDSRFYLFAQEMWRNGLSWFPTTYQHPYPDYPATSTVLITLCAYVFGGLNKFTAVLPSAIMAALTVVLTYQIGALRSKQWGWLAVFFMLLTIAFVKSARAIALDMYPAAITASCFYLVASADEFNKPQRVWWVYPLLLLGFIFRGPIGLVMPAGVVCGYYVAKKCSLDALFASGINGDRSDKTRMQKTHPGYALIKFSLLAFFILTISTCILLALAQHVGGESFMQSVLRMEVLGRLDSSYLPRYFYFTNSLGNYALSYPFALLTIVGAIYYYIKRQSLINADFLLLLTAWMLVIMLGMSIPGDKKDRYILPMMPAIALLAAYPFIALPKQRYFTYLRAFMLRLFLYLPAIFMLSIEAIYLIAKRDGIDVTIHYTVIVALLIILQFASLWYAYRPQAILFFAMLSFVAVNIMVVEPIELYIDRARELVVAVEKQRVEAHAKLVFYREHADNLPIKYLINMPVYEQPIFLETEKALAQYKGRAFFVTSENYFMMLPKNIMQHCQIVANDKLGHVRVVVFTQPQSSQNHP